MEDDAYDRGDVAAGLPAARDRLEDEVWRVRKDGTLFRARIGVASARDSSDDPRSFLRIVRRDDAVQGDAARERDEFVALVAHEVRGPVANLQMLTRALTFDPPTDRAYDVAEAKLNEQLMQLAHEVERLAALIARLHDVAQLASGRIELQLEGVDLAAVVRDVVAGAREESAALGCAVTVRADAPILGNWDDLRLRQIVANLLSNALKYGSGCPVEVTVAGDGVIGRLSVRDYGIGIAEADVPRIFDRFARAAAAESYPGLGVGLWLVHNVVQAMGGKIIVSTAPGKGAEFIVEIPLGAPSRRREWAAL